MSTTKISTASITDRPEAATATARRFPPKLRGRRAACETLDRLVEGARTGHGGALAVRGEGGVGKSVLLDYAAERAFGCHLARAGGVEAERGLPFAGLQQLFGRWTPDGADRLPAPQQEALRSAFGLSQAPAPDRFMVGLAVLNLLSGIGAQRPVVCLIDDLHWVDPESLQVLLFVARRLDAEYVAMVFAVREPCDQLELDELPELVVEGLGHHDARRLLATVIPGAIDEQVRDRIVAETRGNPLALVELPRRLTPAELAGGFGLPEATTHACQLERRFGRRVTGLPADTRQMLLIAAAEAVGDVTLVMRAAEQLELGPHAVAPAESEGLIEFGARIRFSHPLVRTAAYRSASSEDRRRAHAALALASDPVVNPDRQAWHRAHAAAGPEESVAADLEQSAPRAAARGGIAAAAAFLERSAELTPDPSKRGARTLAAASAKFDAGAVDGADKLLEVAGLYPLSELDRARLQRVRARIASARTRGNGTPALLSAAARRLEPHDPRLARETHLEALWAAARSGRFAQTEELVAAAAAASARSDAQGGGAIDRLLEAMILRLRDGYAAAVPAIRTALAAFAADLRRDGLRQDNVCWCWLACQLAAEICDETACVEVVKEPARAARARGELTVLPFALNQFAAHRLFGGDLADAGRLIDEAVAITIATRNPPPVPDFSVLAAAWRGDRTTTAELRRRIIEEATSNGDGLAIVIAEYSLAVLHSGFGEYTEAAAAAARADDPDALGFTMWVLAELIEAAVRSGDRSTAESTFERLEERTRHSSSDWARGIEARSRALLSSGELAEEQYLRAIDHFSRSQVVVNHMRAQLLYGEWLRRENRRVDARVQLRGALTAFEAMGAEAFADRARRELLATGETVRKRNDVTSDDLTPQEAHIARLAADGLTNPEIGGQLYLSPRTVEWHLRKVFAKLDVPGRRQLTHALLDQLPAPGVAR